jgi:undecaprenyl-diphosphatase
MNLQTLDTQLLFFVNQSLQNPLFDVLMPVLSRQGYLLVIPFLFAMIVWGSRTKKPNSNTYLATALWAIVLAVCSYFLVEWVEDVIKVTVGRVRPCRALEGIRMLVPCPKSFSLPSGHAITSFGVALPLFVLTRGYVAIGWRLYPLVLAALIAFSRMYLGVHYPTDVLAGTLLGSVIGLGLALVYRLLENRFGEKKRLPRSREGREGKPEI